MPGRPPSTLTRGMLYLETSDGVRVGDKAHRRAARQLVEIARLARGGAARVRLADVVLSARAEGDRWAVVVLLREIHHSASIARAKLALLLRV